MCEQCAMAPGVPEEVFGRLRMDGRTDMADGRKPVGHDLSSGCGYGLSGVGPSVINRCLRTVFSASGSFSTSTSAVTVSTTSYITSVSSSVRSVRRFCRIARTCCPVGSPACSGSGSADSSASLTRSQAASSCEVMFTARWKSSHSASSSRASVIACAFPWCLGGRSVPGPVLGLEHPALLLQLRGDADQQVLRDRIGLLGVVDALAKPADGRLQRLDDQPDDIVVPDPAALRAGQRVGRGDRL